MASFNGFRIHEFRNEDGELRFVVQAKGFGGIWWGVSEAYVHRSQAEFRMAQFKRDGIE